MKAAILLPTKKTANGKARRFQNWLLTLERKKLSPHSFSFWGRAGIKLAVNPRMTLGFRFSWLHLRSAGMQVLMSTPGFCAAGPEARALYLTGKYSGGRAMTPSTVSIGRVGVTASLRLALFCFLMEGTLYLFPSLLGHFMCV